MPFLLPDCNITGILQQQKSVYVGKIYSKIPRVVLIDNTSLYRYLLDEFYKPTLVAILKAISIEAYKCCVNENPLYITTMFDSAVSLIT